VIFHFTWARDQCGQASQLITTKNKIKFWTWRGNTCSTDMRTKELPAISGKVGHDLLSSISGCCVLFDFLFVGYFYKSIYLLDTAIFHIHGSRILSLQQLVSKM
jgi:hypothetical protein